METNHRNRPAHPFAGARKIKPTRAHRPAIREVMLGAVEACGPDGKWKYFDYDWDGARAHAGVQPDADPRVWREHRHAGYVLYVRRDA